MAKRGPKIKIIPFKELEAEPLTIESLRAYEGCKNYSDEQATNIISTLRQYAITLLKVVLKKDAIHSDNTATSIQPNHTAIQPGSHTTICLTSQKKAA
jgi:hypothetical protein